MAKNKLHLSSKHKKSLSALFKKHLPDVEVWAYGSRVTGKSHPASDLDLVLRSPGLKQIAFQKLSVLEADLKESPVPFLVEARDWALLPKNFHQEIKKNYIVLFKGEKPLTSAQCITSRKPVIPTESVIPAVNGIQKRSEASNKSSINRKYRLTSKPKGEK